MAHFTRSGQTGTGAALPDAGLRAAVRAALPAAFARAVEIARFGPDTTTNPQVGCVLLSPDGETVAEGWHRGLGTAHAEVAALAKLPESWRDRGSELTAVVTLEPCNHTGHTGPCSQALLAAGIGAVVFACEDRGEAARGGADTLRAGGVHVTVADAELVGAAAIADATQLFLEWQQREAGLPFVTVKWAQSLDGRAAAADRTSQWITCPEARADVHRRRALADAILVGTGTVLADDPSLTARNSAGELLVPAAQQPLPVVFGRREVPASANIRTHPRLLADSAELTQFDGSQPREHLRELYTRGVRSVFVEGGPRLISALIAAGVAHECLVYVAPTLLGGPETALGDIGVHTLAAQKKLTVVEQLTLGSDVLFRALLAVDPQSKES